MGDVVEEQRAIQAAFESAISLMEQSVSQAEDGSLALGVTDASELDADPDIFRQLAESLQQASQDVAAGDLVASLINLTTSEVANA